LEFEIGTTNIITGLSKTGKSAVIPIIDYCLCAGKCSIPVGVIRESCEWFGVVVDTVEGEKLFARREPGDKQQTGDMFIQENERVDIPDKIEGKNANSLQGKQVLNRLSGLSSLGMAPDTDSFEGHRASFRDLMAFTFQPQNIVASAAVLFFRADTTEHREKFNAICPYISNSVTQQTLRDRWQLDRLDKKLRQIEAQLKAISSSVSAWRIEADTWLQTAKELGLLDNCYLLPTDWTEVVQQLRTISGSNYRVAKPELSTIEGALQELELLRRQEAEEASQLTLFRQRLLEIKRLIESSLVYESGRADV